MVSFGELGMFQWETEFTDELGNTFPVVDTQLEDDPVDDGDELEDDEDKRKYFSFSKAGATAINWLVCMHGWDGGVGRK